MFSVDSEEWDDLESDHPLRRVKKIKSVVEVSACTFPAYESTEITARSKEALESARSALESARQQDAKSLESEIELLKEKAKILGGS
jgi:phage head maturation protease